MAKAKRVFEIAKDLDVASKAIVDKCQAEGVPNVTNHMSTVKLGLEQTIREWFSEATAVVEATAVEVADKVDLTKVKAKAKPRAKAKSKSGEDESAASGTDTAVAEADEDHAGEEASESASTAAATRTRARDDVAASAAAGAEGDEAGDEVGQEAEAAPEAQAAEAVAEAPAAAARVAKPETIREDTESKGVMNVPDRPDNVKPVGEKLSKPKEAQLKGPRVVRVEQPEPERVAKPRRGPGGPGRSSGQDMGPGGQSPPPGTVDGIMRSRGPQRGRGVGGGAVQDEGAARGKKRTAQSARRSKQNTLPTGPGKYSEQDIIELENRLRTASGFIKQRRRDNTKRGGGHQAATPVQVGGKVEIQEPITIKSLSLTTGIKASDIIRFLFKQGVMATINSGIANETAMEIALEYNIELDVREQRTAEQKVVQQFEDREDVDVRRRPPVVAVLGHVDHGKTSLLDRIRKEDVAAHEAGGITQHIGAYRVTIQSSEDPSQHKTVVFLDTPGHEAFTSMRARGAHVTDIVVLVVAADDGVMPQTIESINHAKAADVPVVVALNKCDRPEATDSNIQKIYGQLAEHGLNPTAWGGETEVMKVSAITGDGVPDLLEVLDYQAELLELKADYGGPARGTVIEAEMQEGRGPVARVLVEQGQMALGGFVVMGRAFGRVRDMTDDHGRHVTDAGPATPLELSGIDIIPDAGDKFYVTNSLKEAEDIARHYRETERDKQLAQVNKVTLDTFHETLQAGQVKDLRVVLKADVQGSVDVLRDSLMKLGNAEVTVKVLHAAVGGVTERDVLLADASDAVVLGFHVISPPVVRDLAEERGVDVRTYRIIYELLDEVKLSLEGMLTPEKREEVLGQAEVKEIFRISKLGNIAGCLVTEGVIQKSSKMRVVRDGVVVTDERSIESLRRVKDDAREVRVGTECGIRLVNFEDVKAGDTLIAYNTIEIKRKLE